MGSPGQEHWSGLPLPSPGDLPNSGMKPTSPALQEDSPALQADSPALQADSPALQAASFTTEPPGKPKALLLQLILPTRLFLRVG